MDPNADNYNSNATVDDGSCDYGAGPIDDFTGDFDFGDDVLGCTNPLADNYDATATIDDGSCFIMGCMNPDADNYNEDATVDDGLQCVIYGCSDKFANNWYGDVVGAIPQGVQLIDDGSCIYGPSDSGDPDDDDGSGGAGLAPPPGNDDEGGESEPSPRLGNPEDDEESTIAITPRRTGGTTY